MALSSSVHEQCQTHHYYPESDETIGTDDISIDNGLVDINKYGFDKMNYYRDNHGQICGVINERGFDAFGYFHKLMPDGTRVKTGNHFVVKNGGTVVYNPA